MRVVRSVTGDVDAASLGTTLSHEHLLMTGGWPVRLEPDFRLDSVDDAAAELAAFTENGGSTVVEMTPPGFGRHPDGLAELSNRTGVVIVAATGLHRAGYYADTHWIHQASVGEVADLVTREVTEGMDARDLAGPLPRWTRLRAGVVKIATEYYRLGAMVEKLAEAAGEAHRRTGVPVATHTTTGTMGHEQLDLLEAAGVPADAVVLGHIDHCPDPVYLGELAGRGAYLECDMPGRAKYGPDSDAVALLGALADRGLTDRVLLGGDLARRSYWGVHGGGPGMGYLLERFAPRLRSEGLDKVADAALRDNPAQAFALRSVET